MGRREREREKGGGREKERESNATLKLFRDISDFA